MGSSSETNKKLNIPNPLSKIYNATNDSFSPRSGSRKVKRNVEKSASSTTDSNPDLVRAEEGVRSTNTTSPVSNDDDCDVDLVAHLVRFAEDTTCHGLGSAADDDFTLGTNFLCRRICWLTLWSIAMYAVVWVALTEWDSFQEYKTTMTVEQVTIGVAEFPQVTICDINPLSDKRFWDKYSAAVIATAYKTGSVPKPKDVYFSKNDMPFLVNEGESLNALLEYDRLVKVKQKDIRSEMLWTYPRQLQDYFNDDSEEENIMAERSFSDYFETSCEFGLSQFPCFGSNAGRSTSAPIPAHEEGVIFSTGKDAQKSESLFTYKGSRADASKDEAKTDEVWWTRTLDPEYGYCYTFDTSRPSHDTGAGTGLELRLHMPKVPGKISFRSKQGVRVAVHPRGRKYAMRDGVTVGPGQSVEIGLRKKAIDSTDVNGWGDYECDNTKGYTQRECIDTCTAKEILSQCKCQPGWLPPTSSAAATAHETCDSKISNEEQTKAIKCAAAIAKTKGLTINSSFTVSGIHRAQIKYNSVTKSKQDWKTTEALTTAQLEASLCNSIKALLDAAVTSGTTKMTTFVCKTANGSTADIISNPVSFLQPIDSAELEVEWTANYANDRSAFVGYQAASDWFTFGNSISTAVFSQYSSLLHPTEGVFVAERGSIQLVDPITGAEEASNNAYAKLGLPDPKDAMWEWPYDPASGDYFSDNAFLEVGDYIYRTLDNVGPLLAQGSSTDFYFCIGMLEWTELPDGWTLVPELPTANDIQNGIDLAKHQEHLAQVLSKPWGAKLLLIGSQGKGYNTGTVSLTCGYDNADCLQSKFAKVDSDSDGREEYIPLNSDCSAAYRIGIRRRKDTPPSAPQGQLSSGRSLRTITTTVDPALAAAAEVACVSPPFETEQCRSRVSIATQVGATSKAKAQKASETQTGNEGLRISSESIDCKCKPECVAVDYETRVSSTTFPAETSSNVHDHAVSLCRKEMQDNFGDLFSDIQYGCDGYCQNDDCIDGTTNLYEDVYNNVNCSRITLSMLRDIFETLDYYLSLADMTTRDRQMLLWSYDCDPQIFCTDAELNAIDAGTMGEDDCLDMNCYDANRGPSFMNQEQERKFFLKVEKQHSALKRLFKEVETMDFNVFETAVNLASFIRGTCGAGSKEWDLRQWKNVAPQARYIERSLDEARASVLSISVYFGSPDEQITTVGKKTTVTDFFGNVGGMFGLICGISVLTMFEFLEFIFEMAIAFFVPWKILPCCWKREGRKQHAWARKNATVKETLVTLCLIFVWMSGLYFFIQVMPENLE
eukprot:g4450.t1